MHVFQIYVLHIVEFQQLWPAIIDSLGSCLYIYHRIPMFSHERKKLWNHRVDWDDNVDVIVLSTNTVLLLIDSYPK